ncbi:hypothetical protein DSUL_140052 [Desulfovibrionales bacterium]
MGVLGKECTFTDILRLLASDKKVSFIWIRSQRYTVPGE